MTTKFKLVSQCSTRVTYAYKTDYEDLSIGFDKETKSVNIHYSHFVFKDAMLVTQWENETNEWVKHSCYYGHWQSETIITLSADDIEFINTKCKELFN